jgi:hypothetical protein
MNAKNNLQEYLVKLKLPVPHYKSSIVGGTHHQPEWCSTVVLYDGTHHQGKIGASKSQADIMAAEVAFEYLTSTTPSLETPAPGRPTNVGPSRKGLGVSPGPKPVPMGKKSKMLEAQSFPCKISSVSTTLQDGHVNACSGLEVKIPSPDLISKPVPASSKKVAPSKKGKSRGATDVVSISIPPLRTGAQSFAEPCIKSPSPSQRTVLIIDLENLPKLADEVLIADLDLDIYLFVGIHHCLASREYPRHVKKIVSPSTRRDGTDTCIQVFVGHLLATQMYDLYLIGTYDHYGSALVEMITQPGLGWSQREARVVTHISHLSMAKG